MPSAGFDTSGFPGVAIMGALKKSTNLKFAGFYLGPAPSHKNAGWMPHRAELETQGWGLVPIYVGRQVAGSGAQLSSNVATASAQGSADGANAIALMHTAGFPQGHWVYLDLENGAPFTAAQHAYVATWAHAVEMSSLYHAGVYCSHVFAAQVQTLLPNARIWAFKVATTAKHKVAGANYPTPAPSGSGYAQAAIWQRDQAAQITVAGKTLLVDLNTAVSANPGG